MYAKLQSYQSTQSVTSCLHRLFVHYQHSSWKNFKYKNKFPKFITKQFHKSLICERENGDKKDNVLNMNNSQYLDYMYKAWLEDQKSVSSSWDLYFKLIHTKNSKDSPAKSNLIRVSSSPKLTTSNLKRERSNSECTSINSTFEIYMM